jgi:hypothetical protein
VPDSALGRWLDDLASEVAAHPRRICHRDYHLNNLFLLPSGEVAVIDAQDALVGPDTYDAVSLLEERAMPELLSDTERVHWRRFWAERTAAAPGWQQRWQRTRTQRALKVLGTFARFAVEGARGYRQWMADLAVTIGPELVSLDAPSVLVDLLLDLSRRHEIGQEETGE